MKHLEQLTLILLLEEPQTGYSLAKNIEEKTGWKPSWGSIYPTLEQLQQKGIIEHDQKGRSKLYHLTTTGKNYAHQQKQELQSVFDEYIQQLHVLQAFWDEDLSMAIGFLQDMRKGINPLLPVQEEMFKVKAKIFELAEQRKIKKHRGMINKLFKQLREALEELE